MIYLGPYNAQGVMVVLNPVFSSKNLLSFWTHVPDISYKHNVALTLVEGGLFVCLSVCFGILNPPQVIEKNRHQKVYDNEGIHFPIKQALTGKVIF